jgi:hypothetical protein
VAFTHYKKVTIDHTQCGSINSTNFVAALWSSDSAFATIANGGKAQNTSGYDIRPYADIALSIPLLFELVPSTYVASTGAFEMHIRIPTLSASTDTVFYLAVGNPSLNTDGTDGTFTLWSINDYGLVCHLGNGSSVSVADSALNGFDGTNNSATAVTGVQGGGGAAVTGGTSVSFPAAVFNYTDNNFTLGVWIKPTSSGTNRAVADNLDKSLGVFINSNLLSIGAMGTSSATITGTITVTTGNWHLLHITRPVVAGVGGTTSYYIDGVLDNTTAALTATVGSAAQSFFGTSPSGLGNNWEGSYDEIRQSSVVRSTSWMLSEYNNQKPGSTFFTFGPLTSALRASVSSIPTTLMHYGRRR